MKLHEVLDSVVDYEVKDNTAGRFWIQSKINGRLISVFFYRDPGDVWELIFAEKPKDNPDSVFWSHKKSGSGGELKVFSLVMIAIKEFLKIHQPKTIFCSSTKSGNRARLYEKLLKKIPGYTLSKEEKEHEIIFTLTK